MLLLVLLTLLCALLPMGLPASQAIGSAFNPANEHVIVRPEKTVVAVAERQESPDPLRPQILPSAHVGQPAALSEHAPAVPVAVLPPRRASVAAAPFSPRAPPFAC